VSHELARFANSHTSFIMCGSKHLARRIVEFGCGINPWLMTHATECKPTTAQKQGLWAAGQGSDQKPAD
jgi:hypothetical protein